LQVQVNQITPNTPATITSVSVDGKKILSTNNKIFEFTLDDSNDHTITILVQDPNRGTKTEETLKATIKRNDIV
jgi:hypothetical protein